MDINLNTNATFTNYKIQKSCYIRIKIFHLQGVAQQLRAMTAFSEEPGLISSNHMVAHSQL